MAACVRVCVCVGRRALGALGVPVRGGRVSGDRGRPKASVCPGPSGSAGEPACSGDTLFPVYTFSSSAYTAVIYEGVGWGGVRSGGSEVTVSTQSLPHAAHMKSAAFNCCMFF